MAMQATLELLVTAVNNSTNTNPKRVIQPERATQMKVMSRVVIDLLANAALYTTKEGAIAKYCVVEELTYVRRFRDHVTQDYCLSLLSISSRAPRVMINFSFFIMS